MCRYLNDPLTIHVKAWSVLIVCDSLKKLLYVFVFLSFAYMTLFDVTMDTLTGSSTNYLSDNYPQISELNAQVNDLRGKL